MYDADRLRRFGLRVGEIAEQMQIVHARERARQIVFDELQRAAHRLDADLDEDAGRLLDVVARGLNEARRLAQLRQDAARALGGRRVREERLAGEARREDVRVVLRVPLPRADVFELEHPRLQVRGEHPVLEPLDAGQRVAVDLVEAAQVAGERVRFAVDPVTAEVLEQIVVRVHAVERRVRRMRLVEVPEQVVDEVRQRFEAIIVSSKVVGPPRRNHPRSANGTINAPHSNARHAVRGRHADRQPRRHHGAGAAGAARSGGHRRRRHAADRASARALRHHDADDEPARAQRNEKSGVARRAAAARRRARAGVRRGDADDLPIRGHG